MTIATHNSDSSENRYRDFVEHLGQQHVFFSNNSQGELTYVSPSVSRILGYDHRQLVGKNYQDFADLTHPMNSDTLQRRELRFRGDGPQTLTRIIPDVNGTERVFQCSTSGRFDASGNVVENIAIATDITEQHRRQEKLSHANESLMKLLSEKPKADGGNAGVDDRAALIHELCQPLFALKTFSTALNIKIDSGQADATSIQQSLRDIDESVGRAAGMLQRYRDQIRGSKSRCSRVGLENLVEDALDSLAYKLRSSDIHIRFDFENSDVAVLVDRGQMEQVFVNLLNNACQALLNNTTSKRLISLSTCHRGNNVEIVVSDNGPGACEEKQHELFSRTQSSKPDGMGVGLALNKAIVEAHQGKIWYTPNKPCGAQFHVLLPCAK